MAEIGSLNRAAHAVVTVTWVTVYTGGECLGLDMFMASVPATTCERALAVCERAPTRSRLLIDGDVFGGRGVVTRPAACPLVPEEGDEAL